MAGCLAKSTLIGWREYYGGRGVGVDRHLCGAQQTRAFDPMLFQYWPTANGAGPTLKQHWVESSCLLGELSAFWYTRAVCVWSEQAAQCSVYVYHRLWSLVSTLSTACTVATFQQTRDIDPMLKQCWATVYDAAPTLVLWIRVSVISPVL